MNNIILIPDYKNLRIKNAAVWFFLGFVVFAFFVFAAFCASRGMQFTGGVQWNKGIIVECRR